MRLSQSRVSASLTVPAAACGQTLARPVRMKVLDELVATLGREQISGRSFAFSMCLKREQLVDQNARKMPFSEVVAIESKALS